MRTRNKPWLQAARLSFVAFYAVTLAVALRWAVSNVHQIGPQSRVVVMRMGRLDRVREAGLLLAWPEPFERLLPLPAAETVIERQVQALLRSQAAQQAEMSSDDDDDDEPLDDALAGSGYLLSGDAGIVQLDVRVFYSVTDPYDYVLQNTHVVPALDRLVTRTVVAVCAARDLDTILVARPELVSVDSDAAERRERLRGELVQRINRRLSAVQREGAGLGIKVTRADVQSSLPRDTVSAFNAVLTASQQADRRLAEARNDSAWIVQNANQSADRSLQVAEAQASERVARAQTDTTAVLELARSIEQRVDPGLAQRLYRERMSRILAQAGSVTSVDPDDESRQIISGGRQ